MVDKGNLDLSRNDTKLLTKSIAILNGEISRLSDEVGRLKDAIIEWKKCLS